MTEDTQVAVEEQVQEALSDNIPNEAEIGRVRVISSAEKVQVWDSRTGQTGMVLEYMLRDKLKATRPDGSRIWTTKDPQILSQRGSVKCLLHKDGEDRDHYTFLGLRVCTKDNIKNFHERTMHMRRKHPKEWDSIQEEKHERERLEDRALQRAILGKVAQIEPTEEEVSAPLYVSGKPTVVRKKRKKK